MTDWKRQNTNIALIQTGSAGSPRHAYVTGDLESEPQLFYWDDLRRTFAINATDYIGYWNDFMGVYATPGPAELQTDISPEGGGTAGEVTVASNDLVLLTPIDSSDEFTTVALGLHWTVSNGFTIFDARFTVDDISTVAFEVGLSDAVSETAGTAFSVHTVAAPTAVADDAIVVAFDSAGDTNFNINSINGGGTAQAFGIGSPPVGATYVTIRIVVNAAGNADVWFNGTFVRTVALAVATTAVLSPWLTCNTLTAGARILSVDYFGIFGTR